MTVSLVTVFFHGEMISNNQCIAIPYRSSQFIPSKGTTVSKKILVKYISSHCVRDIKMLEHCLVENMSQVTAYKSVMELCVNVSMEMFIQMKRNWNGIFAGKFTCEYIKGESGCDSLIE